MSKKKKKNLSKAIFGMSADEQQDILRDIEAIEKGEASILDLGVTPTKRRMTQSAYTQAISACIESKKAHKKAEAESAKKRMPSQDGYMPFERKTPEPVLAEAYEVRTVPLEPAKPNDVETGPLEPAKPNDVETVPLEPAKPVSESKRFIDLDALSAEWRAIMTSMLNDIAAGREPQLPNKIIREKVPVEVEKEPEYPTVKIRVDEPTGHCFINDGIVDTPINAIVAWTSYINLDLVPTDKDELTSLMSMLYFHIITAKYPSCIVTIDEFNGMFNGIESVNPNKYVFFKQGNHVFIYLLEEGACEHFYSVFDVFNLSKEQQIQFVAGAALAANTAHNAFPAADEDEVERVIEIRHDIENLLNIIINDPDTKWSGSDAAPMDTLHVIDLTQFKAAAIDELSDLFDTDEDDDEDDEEEDDAEYPPENSYTGYKYDEEEDDKELEELGLERKTIPQDGFRIPKKITINPSIKSEEVTVTPEPPAGTENEEGDGSMTVPVFHRPKK